MCGIAGILRLAPEVSPEVAIPESWLDTMDRAIAPRGPDASGRWRTRSATDNGLIAHVALVHRRMAIIDISGGAQPMVAPARNAEDGEVAVTFNGCIYNHRDLRRRLSDLGHEFRSDHSDTETVLHGHREWGRGLHEHLEGMYAAGIWDGRERSLVLMRDVAGEKPLYFTEIRIRPEEGEGEGARESIVAFASSAAALFGLVRAMLKEADQRGLSERMRREAARAIEIDPDLMRRWIAFGWGEGTPWVGIRELKPGQIAWFDAQGRSGRRRISLDVETSRSLPLDANSAWSLIERAVEERLEADVPLGCFLSGGVDSGLVAAAAQRVLSKRGERLRTFTMRMPDPSFDESALAAATAAHLGTEHTTLDADPKGAADVVALIEWLGLPFGDSSILPTYWLSGAVRERVRVVLSGDGGDELFAGYERHRAARWLGALRPAGRVLGAAPWPRKDPRSFGGRMARLCEASAGAGYADLVAIFPSAAMRRLCPSGVSEVVFEAPSKPHKRDFETYLPGDLLRKVDTASMRVALEVRAPMLDRDLVYRAMATPLGTLMAGGKRKGMLREAARGVLPAQVVDGPKSGFSIPIGRWFREEAGLRELLRATLDAGDAFDGIGVGIDRAWVRRMVDEHESGARDHAQRLFGLLSLGVWNRWRRG